MVGGSALALSAVSDAGPSATRGDPLPRRVLLVDVDDLGRELLEQAIALERAPFFRRAFQVGRTYSTFWAAPNCSVFRARALTGLDAYRQGNLVGRVVKSSDSFAGPAGQWLPSALPGTRCKLGKWHVSSGSAFPACVHLGGYDKFAGTRGNLPEDGVGYYDWTEHYADAAGETSVQVFEHATAWQATDALTELRRETDFVHLGFNAIHEPLSLPPSNQPPGKVYSGATPDELRLDMLEHLDYWLGLLCSDAVARGYVVVLCCDNGTDGDGKGTWREDGTNTNLVVFGQGVQPGASSRLVQATDLWATVRRLRGDPLLTVPADSRDFTDDFLPVAQLSTPRQFVTVDWFPGVGVGPTQSNWSRMIRDARWKLVRQKFIPSGLVSQPFEGFFDLEADPEERANLLDALPLSSEAQAAYDNLAANLPQ